MCRPPLPTLAPVLALLVATGADAQPGALPPAVRSAAEAISAAQLAWDLAVLASDEFRGRNTPSPGFDAAADYIIARLSKAGLDPVQLHAVARTVLASVWALADAAERPHIDQPIPATVPRHK